MAEKNTSMPNPFSVLKALGSIMVAIAHYIGRYCFHAYTAIKDSWKDGKDMRPEIETSIRSFGVDPAQNWPSHTAHFFAVIAASGMLVGRLFLGLFRALAK